MKRWHCSPPFVRLAGIAEEAEASGYATFVFQSNVEAISSAAQGISESMAAIVACFR